MNNDNNVKRALEVLKETDDIEYSLGYNDDSDVDFDEIVTVESYISLDEWVKEMQEVDSKRPRTITIDGIVSMLDEWGTSLEELDLDELSPEEQQNLARLLKMVQNSMLNTAKTMNKIITIIDANTD